MAWVLEREQPWYAQRLPMLDERVRTRLSQLSAWLGAAAWLDGRFSAGDLMMVSVLLRREEQRPARRVPAAGLCGRATQRPAYQRVRCAAGGIPER
jgi:glutathione S-transferase